jgi:hypothetical protein
LRHVKVRGADAQDIAEFYGAVTAEVDLLVLDDRSGLAGLARLDGSLYAVSWFKGARSTAAMRLGLALLEMIENAGEPVYAVADPDEPTAENTLRHFGFVPDGIDRWVYRGRHAVH